MGLPCGGDHEDSPRYHQRALYQRYAQQRQAGPLRRWLWRMTLPRWQRMVLRAARRQ